MGMLLRHRPEPDTLTTTEGFGKTEEEKKNRQQFWQGKSLRYADPKMREIAAYAVTSYGKL